MPKPARPAKSNIIATAMDFTLGGISGEPLACGSMLIPAIPATAMRIAKRLARMPTTPAAMMELDGPEEFMVQLYNISAGASNTGSKAINGRLWIIRAALAPRTGASRWAIGKGKSTRD